MKLLLFSDLHSDFRRASKLVALSREVDIVVGAGDFCIGRHGLEKIINALAGIKKPSVVVPGNSESEDELKKACQAWRESHVLHGNQVRIDGTVFFERAGTTVGAGRVNVQLLDQRGRIVTTTTTAYDGFFVLSKIPVGKYLLQIAPDQVAELQLLKSEPIQVEVTAEELFVSGADFVLKAAE